MAYRLTKRAERDVIDLLAWIGGRDRVAAERWAVEFRATFERLGDFPHMGMARPDLSPTVRHFPVTPFLILYQPRPYGVQIVRVVRASRDLKRLV